jgi:hypothetical protein
MFFNTGAGVAPRESAGVRTLESGAGLRRALLVGTILSAGVMLQPGVGRAQTVTNITSPITGSAAGVADDQPTSSDNLAITVSAPVTSTANAAIVATRGPGSISVTNNAALNALTNGVYATSVSGAVTVTGTARASPKAASPARASTPSPLRGRSPFLEQAQQAPPVLASGP